MTAAFRRCKDNSQKSGRQRKTCPYEKELEDLLGDRPNVKPVCLVASLPTEESAPKENRQNEPEASTRSADSLAAASHSQPPRKKKCKETRDDRLFAWLDEANKRSEEAKAKWRRGKIGCNHGADDAMPSREDGSN